METPSGPMRVLALTADASVLLALSMMADWDVTTVAGADEAAGKAAEAAFALVDRGSTGEGLEAAQELLASGVTVPCLVIGDVEAPPGTSVRVLLRPFTFEELAHALAAFSGTHTADAPLDPHPDDEGRRRRKGSRTHRAMEAAPPPAAPAPSEPRAEEPSRRDLKRDEKLRAQQERLRADQERKALAQQAKLREQQEKALARERERARAEQERLRAEQEKARAEQEKARAEQERLRAERERLRLEQEQKARLQQERLRAQQEQRARLQQERLIAEQEKARAEQRLRAEQEKARAEQEKARAEREHLRAEREKAEREEREAIEYAALLAEVQESQAPAQDEAPPAPAPKVEAPAPAPKVEAPAPGPKVEAPAPRMEAPAPPPARAPAPPPAPAAAPRVEAPAPPRAPIPPPAPPAPAAKPLPAAPPTPSPSSDVRPARAPAAPTVPFAPASAAPPEPLPRPVPLGPPAADHSRQGVVPDRRGRQRMRRGGRRLRHTRLAAELSESPFSRRARNALASPQDLDALLEEFPVLGEPGGMERVFLEELVELFGPITAAVFSAGPDGAYRVASAHGLTGNETRLKVSPEQPLFRQMLTQQEAVLIAPVDLARGMVAGIGGARTEAMIAAPVVDGDGQCRAIAIVGRDDFTESDLDELWARANEAAPGFAVAQLVEQSRAQVAG